MRKVIRYALLALGGSLALCGGAFAAVPLLCHVAVAWWHDPRAMVEVSVPLRVYAEEGAQDYARHVAALLPAAIKLVETVQGQPFPAPPLIAVYRTEALFKRANGAGHAAVLGTSFSGRVQLAPRLWQDEEARANGWARQILVHELSHAHLQSLLGSWRYGQIPSWFLEGLAVMISDGGGAVRVSIDEARAALANGRQIEVRDSTALFGYPFDPPQPERVLPGDKARFHNMIYRQAGLFVADLRARSPDRFATLMSQLLASKPFASAFATAYGEPLAARWQDFLRLQGRLAPKS